MNKKSQTARVRVTSRVVAIPGAVLTLIEPTREDEFDPIAENPDGEAAVLVKMGDSAGEAGSQTKEK